MPEGTRREGSGTQWEEFAVPEEQCSTPRVAGKRLPLALGVTVATCTSARRNEITVTKKASDSDSWRQRELSTERGGNKKTKTAESTSSGATVKSYRVVAASTQYDEYGKISRPSALEFDGGLRCQTMAATAMPGRRLATAAFSIPCMILV